MSFRLLFAASFVRLALTRRRWGIGSLVVRGLVAWWNWHFGEFLILVCLLPSWFQTAFRSQYNVAMTMHPLSKLRGMLVHPKDKLSLAHSTWVVYQIPCKACDKVYVGETGRKLELGRQNTNKNQKLSQRPISPSRRRRRRRLSTNLLSVIMWHNRTREPYHWMENEQAFFQGQQQIYQMD